jgi:kynurenine formamidase
MRAWPDRDAFLLDEPGLNREGAEFLARAGAIVIGGDNIALEQLPSVDPDNWVPVHTYLLAEAGVPIMEVVNLEEIAAEELYEFAFVGAPLKLRGATAAPLRPFALPLRS